MKMLSWPVQISNFSRLLESRCGEASGAGVALRAMRENRADGTALEGQTVGTSGAFHVAWMFVRGVWTKGHLPSSWRESIQVR